MKKFSFVLLIYFYLFYSLFLISPLLAQSPNGAELWVIKKNQTGSGKTEVHILSYGSLFNTYVLHSVSPIEQIYDNRFQFTASDYSSAFHSAGYKCLWAIKKWGTGTNSTEVHILDPSTGFSTYINETGTALPETNDDYSFLAGNLHSGQINVGDLWAIKKNNTASGNFEVQILSGSLNFQQITTSTIIPIKIISGQIWQFALGDFNEDGVADLYMFKISNIDGQRGTKIEIHVRNGNDLTQTLLDVLTPVDMVSDPTTIQMTVGNIQHPYTYSPYRSYVYLIKKNGTGSQTTEVHILNRETNYTSFFVETATALEQTYDNFEFAVAQYNQITDFDKKNTNKNNESFTDGTTNFPNPFNPSTIINYKVSAQSDVIITVYDLLGRFIKTLVDERKEKGDYKVTFNANQLSSGVYFYKVVIGDKFFIKKLILQK